MPRATIDTLTTSDADNRRPIPHPAIAKYIPAGFPSDAVLAYYLVPVAELGARVGAAQLRLAAQPDRVVSAGAAGD